MDTSTTANRRTYRGSYFLYLLRSYRVILPLLALTVLIQARGFASFVVAVLLLAVWSVVLRLARPERSSVSVEGTRVIVRNPLQTYHFEANDITVMDTDVWGTRAPGSLVVRDSHGRRVTCYGLGRRILLRPSADLQEFRLTVHELGAKVYVASSKWSAFRTP
jgi:hypothetical protein